MIEWQCVWTWLDKFEPRDERDLENVVKTLPSVFMWASTLLET